MCENCTPSSNTFPQSRKKPWSKTSFVSHPTSLRCFSRKSSCPSWNFLSSFNIKKKKRRTCVNYTLVSYLAIDNHLPIQIRPKVSTYNKLTIFIASSSNVLTKSNLQPESTLELLSFYYYDLFFHTVIIPSLHTNDLRLFTNTCDKLWHNSRGGSSRYNASGDYLYKWVKNK